MGLHWSPEILRGRQISQPNCYLTMLSLPGIGRWTLNVIVPYSYLTERMALGRMTADEGGILGLCLLLFQTRKLAW